MLDALLLETNHDLDMLRNGPYPWSLKQRVAGRHGHLSNRDAAEGLPELVRDGLRHVVLYHLSRPTTSPRWPRRRSGRCWSGSGPGPRWHLGAGRATPWLTVG